MAVFINKDALQKAVIELYYIIHLFLKMNCVY